MTCVQDVFTLIPAAEIRALREESPSNLATLCYKAVEKLVAAAESGCNAQKEQQTGSVKPRHKKPDLQGFRLGLTQNCLTVTAKGKKLEILEIGREGTVLFM